MDAFYKLDYSVLCVTNDHKIAQKKIRKNLKFLTYEDITKLPLVCGSTIFSWRDSEQLLRNDLELYTWMESYLYVTKNSLFLSSASVYKNSPKALDESFYNLDLNVKMNKKFILEEKLSSLLLEKNIKHVNIRISNAYGEDLKYGLIGSLINSIEFNDSVSIFQNLQITRDYIHVNDIVYAVQQLIDIETNEGCLNISTGIGTTISELLQIFAKNGFKFENQNKPLDSYGIKNGSILNCSALRSLIKWHPRKLENEIEKLLDKFKS